MRTRSAAVRVFRLLPSMTDTAESSAANYVKTAPDTWETSFFIPHRRPQARFPMERQAIRRLPP